MKAIDINILVRFLIGDDELQAQKVHSIFKKAEAQKRELFVPVLVMLEMVWVLDSVYQIPRAEIIDVIKDILLMPIFKFDQLAALQQFVISAQENAHDLSDLLIAHCAKANGCETVMTFDKKASKFPLFELAK